MDRVKYKNSPGTMIMVPPYTTTKKFIKQLELNIMINCFCVT